MKITFKDVNTAINAYESISAQFLVKQGFFEVNRNDKDVTVLSKDDEVKILVKGGLVYFKISKEVSDFHAFTQYIEELGLFTEEVESWYNVSLD